MTRWIAAACVAVVWQAALAAQTPATIRGDVTTRSGTIALPGVIVEVRSDPAGALLVSAVTDARGQFRFPAVAPGTVQLRATLSGFQPAIRRRVVVMAGQDVVVTLDLPLTLSTTVTAESGEEQTPISGDSGAVLSGDLIDIAPVKGDDYQAVLPLLPGVVRAPDGRISVKGGRPAQTGLQVNDAYASDPVTGGSGVGLPVDAVETLDVLPNPYTAEYGRFSAGVTRVETRRGGDRWKTTANNFIPVPCFTLCDERNWGVRSYDPRLLVSGPIVPQRLFLAQSLQVHDKRDRVPSLPADAQDTGLRGLESFTRIDLVAGRHAIMGAVAAFPQNVSFAGLNTFNPQSVSPDVRRRGASVNVMDTWRWSDATFIEVSASRTWYRNDVVSRTPGDMVITPDGASGSFFNQTSRRASASEGSVSITLARRAMGDHALKIGVDVLQTSFTGTSVSAPVDIRREDGTLAERLEFGAPTAQAAAATDAGAFVQDRWRFSDRLVVDLGLRADRDGVSGRYRASPRAGFVLGLRSEGRSLLRGGVGAFTDRTPLLAAAFSSIEAPIVQRFDADGVTPEAPAIAYASRVAGPLTSARSRVWNLEYDERLPAGFVVKLNHLERDGRDELVVEPIEDTTGGVLQLSSSGRSAYRETELTVKRTGASGREITASYVYSRSRADLNGFDDLFGTLRQPIVHPEAYGPTSADAPHRLVVSAVLPVRAWTVAPLVEVHTGFPYSILDEAQEIVGVRNEGGRFPTFASLDLNILRTATIHGRRLRLGFRSNHLLGNFTPRDVQANVASPAFGTFANSLVRRIGFTVEILP